MNIKIFFHIWSEVNCDDIIQDIYSYFPDELKPHVVECRNPIEMLTYDRIYDEIKTLDDYKIGYVHTNGAFNRNECIDSLRQFMCYFNFTKYRDCISALDNYDCCGVDFRTEPQPHFSGNVWWANSSYLRSLPHPRETYSSLLERHKCEFWACSGINMTSHSFHDSGVDVYSRHKYLYPKERYI